ncbi:MAG: thioredoxin-disulfide reductase [Defluviitaleaceae bacterium]|nr:thioredoxin-disulfide reductase [Defluviitaleaceae bacterium]
MEKIYDVIIIGGGPAGLSAALYAGRARLDVLMIEKMTEGGQIATTNEIENYPGGLEEDSGPALSLRMKAQAKKFGAAMVRENVVEVDLEGDVKVVKTDTNTYKAKSIIAATGAKPRLLDVPGEKELTGMGVSYCATCDGAFFADLPVFVIGGGDSAVEEALFLTRYAKKVTIIHRRDSLKAAKYLQDQAIDHPKIDFIWNSAVKEIKGKFEVKSMTIKNLITNETTEIEASEEDGTFGIFVFVGLVPLSELFEGKLDMDGGYIITNENMETNIKGVYAAGDIRAKTLRQVVTAAADGAIAATQVDKYLNGH